MGNGGNGGRIFILACGLALATPAAPASAQAVVNAERGVISSTVPWIYWHESDATTNEKYWRWVADGGRFLLQSVNDAENASNDLVYWDRNGLTPPRLVSNLPIQANGSLSQEIDHTTLRGFQNVEIGRRAGGPAVRLENGSTVWNMDVVSNTWRLFRDLPTVSVPIQVADDIFLAPSGNDVLPSSNYQTNLGMLTNKFLTLHAAELWVETLVAQNTMATIGGRVLVSPTNILTRNLIASDFSGVYPTQVAVMCVKYNSFQLHVGGVELGSKLFMESNGKFEAFYIIDTVTPGVQAQGDYCYTVYRNIDNTGTNDWFAGDAILDTGKTGSGYIDLYSVRGLTNISQIGPSIAGMYRANGAYNGVAPRWAIGNLNGLYGYGTNVFGAAFGDPSATNITIDTSSGIRIRSGASDRLVADTAGNLTLTGNLTIGNTGFIKSGGKSSCTGGDGIWIAYNGTVGQACIGTQTGNRLNWDGTNLLLKSNRLQIDQNGIQIAPTNSSNYDSPSSVSFGPLGMGGSNYIQSFESGAVRTMVLQNQTASGFASHVSLWASSSGHTLDGDGRLDVRGGTSANDGYVQLSVGVSGSLLQVVSLYGFGSNGIFGPWGVASPGVVDLGRQGAKWGDIWHTPVQTTAVLWPLVDNAGRIEAKTDGSNAALACPPGQAIKNITVEFGIVVGVSCGPI
jgi:hypothetical protein